MFFFFKQNTAYEMRISDWSSDVCSSDLLYCAFPLVPVPSEAQYNWTMVHAIARQESQFDRQIVSHAGARGLMQLMPGTARAPAGKLGMSYDPSSLNDTSYHIMLGSSYFPRLLDYSGGSYPLALAASIGRAACRERRG